MATLGIIDTQRSDRSKGKRPKPLDEPPKASEQSNLTAPDSRSMRKSRQHEYRQARKAQAAVGAEVSQLVMVVQAGNRATDIGKLAANVKVVPAVLRLPETVPASGYANGTEPVALAERCIGIPVSASAEDRRRPHDCCPPRPANPTRQPEASRHREMASELDSKVGRAVHRLRKQTVEPVFGIVMAVLGFTRFYLLGLDKVDGEWHLVTPACNCKRLHDLRLAA